MTDEAHFPRRLHTLRPLPDGSPRGAYDQDGHCVLSGPQTIGGECIYDREAFQARLIASYNACEGVPVEALEEGVVQALSWALSALTDPEGHIWHGGNDECTGECKDVRAALAKATGAQP